jgi:hypothetical protein
MNVCEHLRCVLNSKCHLYGFIVTKHYSMRAFCIQCIECMSANLKCMIFLFFFGCRYAVDGGQAPNFMKCMKCCLNKMVGNGLYLNMADFFFHFIVFIRNILYKRSECGIL